MSLLKPILATDEREIIDSIQRNGADRKNGEERLFNRYSYFIQEGIYKYSLTQDESFDVYSDTILSAIEKIAKGSFEGRSTLKTWLYQIFHNKYVDLLRKKTTNKSSVHQTASISDLMLQVADSAKTIIQQLVDKTDKAVLRQKLDQVGDNCRKMLLFWADGFSDREIAAEMDYKSADVVKTSRLRCLEKLKQLYRSS